MDCNKCPHKQLCYDLPSDMNCDDVLNYARDAEKRKKSCDELVKRLRNCTAEQNGEKTLWCQAADAIEELATLVATWSGYERKQK